jgi:hypothetical protein
LRFSHGAIIIENMSGNVETMLEKIQNLPASDQRELLQELGRRISQTQPAAQELYGEPLTDKDIEESARVAFKVLDEEENRA